MDDNTVLLHHHACSSSRTPHETSHWNRHLPSRRTKSCLLIVSWSCESAPSVGMVRLPNCKAGTTWRQSIPPLHLCVSAVKRLLVPSQCLERLVVWGVCSGMNNVHQQMSRLYNLQEQTIMSRPPHHCHGGVQCRTGTGNWSHEILTKP